MEEHTEEAKFDKETSRFAVSAKSGALLADECLFIGPDQGCCLAQPFRKLESLHPPACVVSH